MTQAAPATRRLFFALWPDAGTRNEMAHACRKAVRGSGGRPVAAANLHVTLAFLGSVAETRLSDLQAVVPGLAGGPPGLLFDQVEFWPRPRVLVAACTRPPPAIEVLVRQLWSRLAPLGYPPDLRPYRPHVTLARKVSKPPAALAMRPVRWPVTDLSLVESITDPAGARYVVLDHWPLSYGAGSGVSGVSS
jgi:2'-5' RNA ligase